MNKTRTPWSAAAVYLGGCLTFAVGAYLFVHSALGADPLDTFALGVLHHLPLTVGIVQTSVAVCCLVVVGLWTRRRPPLSPLLTFFLCGSIIDLQRHIDWMRDVTLPSAGILAAATLLCAYGSALIIMSGFGIRSIDLLAITAREHIRLPFWVGKGSIEMTLLAVGFLLGGPVGIGTVSFLVGVDLLIQPLVLFNLRWFRIPNRGMPLPAAVAVA